jgi:predicted DNA-binding transcriptional regulator AlpA
MQEQLSPTEIYLTSAQLRARLGGVSEVCIWRWLKDPRLGFPKPAMTIHKRRYWLVSQIQAWERNRDSTAA